jgi:dTDP-4-amino-4,6-dideoxygalactose transaminase
LPAALAIHGGPKVRPRPFPRWPVAGREEEQALLAVLRDGNWGLGSERIRAFEAAFAAYQGCRYGVTVCNGTLSLYVALLAAGVRAGDEIIVPPYTFLATASAAVQANCVPIFVDIRRDSCCIDPDRIAPAVTPRTRAILPVHLGGRSADMDAILAVAREHDLAVIEDCAQAHGAEYNHRRVGSLGQMGSFSFQSSKNLTSGEGGIIVTNDPRLHERCESIHNCGRLAQGQWYGHHVFGANLRMTAFQASLLLAQMRRLDAQAKTRSANAAYLAGKLAAVPGIEPLGGGDKVTRHAWHLFIFRYDAEAFGGASRARFIEAVRAEGVPVSAGYGLPLYRQPWFQRLDFGPYTAWRQTRGELDYGRFECPVCEEMCAVGCWLPQHVLLGGREDMDDIVRAIAKVHDARGGLAG